MPCKADLLALLESDTASFEARLEAGEALAVIGDPRATAIDRVRIPAGKLRRRRGEAVTENCGAPLEVTISAFSIDRYPVTVAAYAEFIECGGYRDRALWSKRGWAWREREQIAFPRFWGEAEWGSYLVPN